MDVSSHGTAQSSCPHTPLTTWLWPYIQDRSREISPAFWIVVTGSYVRLHSILVNVDETCIEPGEDGLIKAIAKTHQLPVWYVMPV